MNYLYNQQTKLSNCFILSNYVMNLDLSATALAIYCYLMYIEDRKNYECYPSYKTIGDAIGVSINTVRKYVARLEERKLITTEPTIVSSEDGQLRNGTLLYTIRPIQEALDYDQECRLLKFDATLERQKTEKLLKQYEHKSEDGDSA